VTRWWTRGAALVALAVALGCAVAACGLDVQEADLFVLTRTGQGTKLKLLVNDSGTIRCNGGKAKQISSALLIQARDLSIDLGKDAKKKLTIPAPAGTVFYYRITMEPGTIAFPDRSAASQKPLREAEQFTIAAATGPCGLSG
jgi:hypothetical protein